MVARPAKRSWRRHSDEFKARVIELARQPNASMAAVALANGLNANMLRRWVRERERRATGKPAGQDRLSPMMAFVQLPMAPERAAPASVEATNVDVQIHRGDTRVLVSLPLASVSATWLREVLA